MKFVKTLFALDMQLFAEGTASAGGGSTGAESAGVTAADAGQQDTGVTAADAGQQSKGVTPADAGQAGENPNAEFDTLVKGKFKSQFDARMQEAIRERLKAPARELKTANEKLQRYDAAAPVFQILAAKYGLEATDLEGISTAIQKDASFVEEEALAMGVDPKTMLQMKQAERENASMRQRLEAQEKTQQLLQRQQQAQRQAQEWEQQAQEARKVYPGLDLKQEMKNDLFKLMLTNGFPVQNAYEAVHTQEIIRAGMAYASQKGAQAVTDHIIAGKDRPTENGTSAQGAAATKLNPAKLTKQQRDDLIARARRGERITF